VSEGTLCLLSQLNSIHFILLAVEARCANVSNESPDRRRIPSAGIAGRLKEQFPSPT
jgi:hypothetical protein